MVWICCSLYCDSLKLNRVSEVNDLVGFLCSELRTALEFQVSSKWTGVWKPTDKLFVLSFFNVEIRPVYIQWKKECSEGSRHTTTAPSSAPHHPQPSSSSFSKVLHLLPIQSPPGFAFSRQTWEMLPHFLRGAGQDRWVLSQWDTWMAALSGAKMGPPVPAVYLFSSCLETFPD